MATTASASLRTAGRALSTSGALTALLVAVAAAVNSLLVPERFHRGAPLGWIYLGIGLIQWSFAFALVHRPGPAVNRTGIRGSVIVVLGWIASRLVPVAGGQSPGTLEMVGAALDVASVVALASLPSAPPRARTKRKLIAVAAGASFALLVLFSSGAVSVIPEGGWPFPAFQASLWQTNLAPFWRFNGIWVIAGPWSLVVWITMGFLVPASVLVAWTVWMALRLPAEARCSARRRGVVATLPAVAAVPLCCGASLLSLAAPIAAGTAFRWTPWILGAALIALSVNALLLRRRRRWLDQRGVGPRSETYGGGTRGLEPLRHSAEGRGSR